MYGIDMEDRAALHAHTWRWLRVRILGLLAIPPVWLHAGDRVIPVPQSRLGYALYPPGRE